MTEKGHRSVEKKATAPLTEPQPTNTAPPPRFVWVSWGARKPPKTKQNEPERNKQG